MKVKGLLAVLSVLLVALSAALVLVDAGSHTPGALQGNTGFAPAITHPTQDVGEKANCASESTCTTSTGTLTYPGDFVIAVIEKNTTTSGATATITNVKDNYGDSLTYVGTALEVNANVTVYYEANLPHSGTFQVFVNWTGSLTSLLQWNAVYGTTGSPIDADSATGTGHGTAVSVTMSSTKSSDLGFMAMALGKSSTNTAAINGAAQVLYSQGTSISGGLFSKSLNSSGSYTIAGTAASSAYWAEVPVYIFLGSVPSAPTLLAVSSTTTTGITWTWTPAAGTLTNQTVFTYSTAACGGTITGHNVASGTNTYTQSALSANTNRGIKVADWNSTGMGTLTSCVAGVTNTVPGAPTSLAVTSVTITSISYSWSNPSGTLTNSTFYWTATASCAGVLTAVNIVSASTTTYTLTGLTTAVEYWAQVTTWNATGQSAASSCVG